MVADLTRSIDELRHRRVQLRKRIVLLTGPMPPGPPDDCRRQAEKLKAELLIGGILELLDSCNDDLCKLNPEIQRLIKERLAAAVRSAA